MKCVLDASMALAFVIADEFAPPAQEALSVVAQHGAVVPTLWDFEVLHALRSAERQGRLTQAAVTYAINGLARLPIERDSRGVDGARLVALARETGLSVYDSSYLDLALHANLPLASLDDALVRAANGVGARLLDAGR